MLFILQGTAHQERITKKMSVSCALQEHIRFSLVNLGQQLAKNAL
jgi:hypothetical protein